MMKLKKRCSGLCKCCDALEECKIRVKEAWERRLMKAKKMSEETNDPRFVSFVGELFYDDIQDLGLE